LSALIIFTEVLEYLDLAVLIALSVWSISIIIDRHRTLKNTGLEKASELSRDLAQGRLETLAAWCKANPGFLATSLQPLLDQTSSAANSDFKENMDRAVSAIAKIERLKLEKGLAVLATLGSNAPFIGLLGTVLGIIRAFASLANQNGTQAVMSGVSQALYATALGLVVAIPAVVTFNIFTKKIRELTTNLESLKDQYLSHSQGRKS
jgi:biopolymer transport protein ExbB